MVLGRPNIKKTTCFYQGDPEPPGHPSDEHPVAEDEAVHQQLNEDHAAEEYNAPAALGIGLSNSFGMNLKHIFEFLNIFVEQS